MTDSQGSVTRWICNLQQGEHDAFDQLWDTYYPSLAQLARKQLQSFPQALYDEEDAVTSAFFSIFSKVCHSKHHNLTNRTQFWRLAATITSRKIYRQFRQARALKRGPGLTTACATTPELLCSAPSPDLAAEYLDQLEFMIDLLPQEELKRLVWLKISGFTNQEIAVQLKRGLSSIERKLRTIRKLWENASHELSN